MGADRATRRRRPGRLGVKPLVGAVLLDSTVLIDILRGRPDAVERLSAIRRAADIPYTSAVNVEEVVRGLRDKELDRARLLFAGLRTAPLDVEEGVQAGRWRRDHARRGLTLSQADCLIAAAAVGVGATLATGNPKHFPMRGLRVEHWVVGA